MRSRIEEPGAKYLNFPQDLDSNWYEGFCSEVQVQKHKNVQAFYVWEKLSGVRNETLDTSVYAIAAAHLVGLTRIKWKDKEQDVILEDEQPRADGRRLSSNEDKRCDPDEVSSSKKCAPREGTREEVIVTETSSTQLMQKARSQRRVRRKANGIKVY